IYKSLTKINHDNFVSISKLIIYLLPITKDNDAPSSSRTLEISTVNYWKSVTLLVVDGVMLIVFAICIVALLGSYSFFLFLFYLASGFFFIYVRFKSYKSTIHSNNINNVRLTDSISLRKNKAQVRFIKFDELYHAFYSNMLLSDKLNYKLDTHNHKWSEFLKLNSFLSMVFMYIVCYLAINSGLLPKASIIAVLIINTRLSVAIISVVNSVYIINVSLYQIKNSLMKLTQGVILPAQNLIKLERIKELTLENVTIESHGRATLSQYNATFSTGSIVIVQGQVGMGKSSFVRSLIAQPPLMYGYIRYNQVNITNIDALTFQREVAYYEPSLSFFKGTLRFNFNLYGVYESERMIFIIKKCCPNMSIDANFLDDVDVDELKLSAGEKQKIIIYMMLEKKPSLIILDDPTSFISENEGINFLRELVSEHKDSIFVIATHNSDVSNIGTEVINIAGEDLSKRIFIQTNKLSMNGIMRKKI
ncbi:ATP-binding cassette domain-containing protein, partial [Salmonella enterica subsp. enterica serovar Alachua]|nr:ATP-binding cassette domain-containing protein [Salmonella enterica subsp. enterica serovar Kentucky]EKK3806530.1 ATP-binding cassette domain-containing protein [Salmonella enterica subsp. enterica serovar Alachua]